MATREERMRMRYAEQKEWQRQQEMRTQQMLENQQFVPHDRRSHIRYPYNDQIVTPREGESMAEMERRQFILNKRGNRPEGYDEDDSTRRK